MATAPVSVTKKQAMIIIFIIGTTAGAVWKAAESKYCDLDNLHKAEVEDCRLQRSVVQHKLDECHDRLLYFLAPDDKTDYPTAEYDGVTMSTEELWDPVESEQNAISEEPPAWEGLLDRLDFPGFSP